MKSGYAASAAWSSDPNGGSALRANDGGWILRTDLTGQCIGASTVRLGKLMSSFGALDVSFYENPIHVLWTRTHGGTPALDRSNTLQASLAESWANRCDG